MSEQWLTVEDIAKELSVHPETVRVWIRNRELKALVIKRTYRIRRTDFEEFIRQHETQGNGNTNAERTDC